jgi:hypothetical protein
VSPPRRSEAPLEILDVMRRHPVPMEERPDSEARRRAAIGEIASAIRESKKRRWPVRRLAPSALAAALVCAVALVAFKNGHFAGRILPSSPRQAPPAEGALGVLRGAVAAISGGRLQTVQVGGRIPLARGDRVESPVGGEAQLSLPRGVDVKLVGLTRLRLLSATELEQRLELAAGRVEVSVPKPGGPKIVEIDTPDSEVIVHGTQFSVLVTDGEGGRVVTSVSVTRGAVMVVHAGERRLIEAGATWSSEVPPVPASTTTDAPASMPPSVATSTPRMNRAARPVPVPSLTEQNRLFQAFIEARDAGDDAAAVRHLDELLTRFPDTPLADQARLARFRALQRLSESGSREK